MRLTRALFLVVALLALGFLPGCKFTANGPTISGDVAGPDDDAADPDVTEDSAPVDVDVDKCKIIPQPEWFHQGVCAGATATHSCDSETGAWHFDSTGLGAYERDADGVPLEKTCDGLDNDCDGSTDEDIVLQTDDTLYPKVCDKNGVCGGKARAICNPQAGATAGADDRWICDYTSVPDYEPDEISCDGKDNDCDNKTDKGLDVALADCNVQGVCGALKLVYADAETPEGLPAVRCEGGAWKCEYQLVPGWQEAETLCDGQDNDCDGLTDEADTDSGVWTDVAGADAGCKVAGVCLNTRASCSGGAWVCAYPSAQAGYEPGTEYRCDGEDNDCDGLTDEELATVALSELALVKQADPTHPVSSLPCLNEANLVGICAALQVATCKNAGVPGASWDCPYERIPGYQPYGNESLCDGHDNDCDGQTDLVPTLYDAQAVGVGCAPAKGVCAKSSQSVWADCSEGRWICSFATPGAYQAFETSCDNQDNDCDGETDEGLFLPASDPDIEATCGAIGVNGVCKNATLASCNPVSHSWSCQVIAPTYESGAELHCDGLDNDCNGQTDEDFGAAATPATKALNCPALGQCAGHAVTSFTCVAGKPVCVYQGVVDFESGKETRCDGLDNDCDGLVDSEDPDLVTLPASEVAKYCPDKGVCQGKSVTLACNHGVPTCTYAGITGYEPKTETSCDGQDNDCDGLTDEGITRPDTTGACAGGGGVCKFGGNQGCNGAGGWTCDYGAVVGYEPAEVSCDNLDNDCDGQTDEGLDDVPPSEGLCLTVGACASASVSVSCAGGAWTCDYSAADGWAEVEDGRGDLCDTVDNDCDGQTDEHTCGGAGTLCTADDDCRGTGGSPDAFCRQNIDGAETFCAASDTMCCYSENGLWADQVPDGQKRCVDDHHTRVCQAGLWTTETACPAQTPFCTGLSTTTPCSVCIPDAPMCYDQDTRGRCASDGTNKVADQPCLLGSYCVGDGLCVSTSESVLNAYTTGLQEQPDVAWHPVTGFTVVWASKGQDNSDYGVYGRRLGDDGLRIGQEFRVNQQTANTQTEPAVAMRPDGGFVVVWRSSHAGTATVYRRSFDLSGVAVEADDTLVPTTFPDKTKIKPDVAVNSQGDTLIVYQANGNEGTSFGCTLATCKDGIGARSYNGAWQPDDEIVVNETYTYFQKNPTVAALSNDNFVVVWESEKQDSDQSYGVYGRIVKPGGIVSGSEFHVNQAASGNQISAFVATRPDGKFVVAWNTATISGGSFSYSIWMRVFKDDGTPDSAEMKISGDVSDATLTTATAFGDSFPMIGWQQAGDGDGSAVYATVYTTTLLTDGPFGVNETTAGDQTALALAGTDIRTYLAAWVGPDVSGTGTDIRVRLRPR